ncbi:MAG TPA: zf-HC2 domain-containing protein [Vicinamibacterales bacterium]|nr:zf-HC2 domain-containing protein [Vicinamibacterales bacterium]
MSACGEIQPHLGAYIDGALPAEERADVARHLDQCAVCRGVVRDLERLRGAARSLGPMRPPDHIWLEIAGQLRATAGPAATPAAAPTRRPILWQWVGLAAALVLVTMAVYALMRAPRVAVPPSNAGQDAAVKAVADELKLAMQHYENAITQLEALTKNNNGAIDPVIAATLQKNLDVVDQAIAESRVALTNNPESEPARESLFGALRRKVGVLQATVTLMNQMRQGNPAGAAESAAGLGRKSS